MKFFTKHLTTTQMIVLSFLVVILIGAFLLQLPIAASDGQVTSFIDAFNLETLKGLVQFLQKAFKGTFFVEGIGALCYMPVFIPEYGAARGIWYSVFHSVSAFCNAGIQILVQRIINIRCTR